MVNINQETLLNKIEFPYVPVEDLKHIHSYIKSLFCARKIPNVQLAWTFKNFLTNGIGILSLVEGYITLFHKIIQQKNIPIYPSLRQEEKILLQKKIHEMLNKGATVETPNHLEGKFITSRWWAALSSNHSREGTLHVQIEMEGRILFSSIKSYIQKVYLIFLVWETLWASLPFFWTWTSPKIFTKLLKISVSVLRRLNILITIYLDDTLLIGHTIEETLVARDTVIFLLQQLGSVLNLKKLVLTPTQRIKLKGWQ